jgi:hypothetical protein
MLHYAHHTASAVANGLFHVSSVRASISWAATESHLGDARYERVTEYVGNGEALRQARWLAQTPRNR